MIFKILSIPDSLSIPKDTMDKFTNYNVAKNFYVSRLALFECLKELKPNEFADRSFDALLDGNILKIEDHHALKEFPEILTSISHTSGFGAATIAPKSKFLGIGIDIELESRKINPKIEDKFLNDEDDPSTIQNLLQSWCMKEAAFKALDPISDQFFDKKPLVLSDIWLKSQTFGLKGDRYPIGKINSFIKSIDGTNLITSLAFIEVE